MATQRTINVDGHKIKMVSKWTSRGWRIRITDNRDNVISQIVHGQLNKNFAEDHVFHKFVDQFVPR